MTGVQKFFLVSCLAALSLGPSRSHAYLLPGDFIIKKVAERLVKVADLKVQGRATLFEPVDQNPRSVAETLFFLSPGRYRSERQLPDGLQVQVWRDGGMISFRGETILAEASGRPHLLTRLLLGPAPGVKEAHQKLSQDLQALGVDTGVVSLSRFHGRIALVVGAQPGDLTRPQLWVEKDRFYPLRYLGPEYPPAKQGEKPPFVEIKLFDYDSPQTSEWFPRVIELYRQGRLVWRSEVDGVEVNKGLDGSLFDLTAIKRKLRHRVSP